MATGNCIIYLSTFLFFRLCIWRWACPCRPYVCPVICNYNFIKYMYFVHIFNNVFCIYTYRTYKWRNMVCWVCV